MPTGGADVVSVVVPRYLIGRLRGEVCKALAGGLSAASTVGGRAAGFLDRWSGRGVWTVRRGAVAGGSGEGSPSCAKRYTDRPKTAYEHAWEIRTRHPRMAISAHASF